MWQSMGKGLIIATQGQVTAEKHWMSKNRVMTKKQNERDGKYLYE